MVIARGIRLGTLYKLEEYIVKCNSTYMKNIYVHTLLKDVRVSPSIDGDGFWVPKGIASFEENLPINKTILWH